MAKKTAGHHPSYITTGGNILTPVEGFSGGIFSGGPSASARGMNKAPGEDTFPIRGGAAKKSNPMGAFGLGGDKK